MKKHLRIIVIVIILISIATILFLNEFVVVGRDNSAIIRNTIERNKSIDDSNWSVVKDESIVLENNNVKLDFDARTTHFTITNKIDNHEYSSVPKFDSTISSIEDENRIKSDLTIEYYDNKSMKKYLSSSTNSVDYGSFIIKKSQDAIRVYYTLRNSKTVIFAPVAFTQKDFDEKILTRLSASEKRRIKFFYTLFEKSNKNSEYLKMVEKYPYLANESMYIQNAGIEDQDFEEITGYMAKVDYNEEEYAISIDKMGLSEDLQNKPVSFEIVVEYTLSSDGFCAKILSDKIKTPSSNYTLQNASLLEYFGSAGANTEGYFVVPDGCGAILPVNEKKGQKYEKHLYGNNPSTTLSLSTQSVQNSTMPVFGFNRTTDGIFAIIEGAAEESSICARTLGNENPANNIYAKFDLRGMDSTDIGKNRNIPVLNLYSKHIVYENPKVRYVLMEKESSGYSKMANYYQNYLISKGVLKTRLDYSENIPVFIDFAGFVTKSTSIMGIPYQKKIVLSSVSDIGDIVTSLKSVGIDNCNVRLQGYGNGGLANYVNNKFDLDSRIGNVEEINELAANLSASGGNLYLEGDFSIVYKKSMSNPFSLKLDSARKLDKSFVRFGDYDLITHDFVKAGNQRNLVTPSSYILFADKFLQEINDKLGAGNKVQHSWSSSGNIIGSDFNNKNEFDMPMAREAVQSTLSLLGNGGKKIMTDGGNSYVLGYVDCILNLPLSSSLFESQERSIPFYQMVVHGFVDYAGAPFNISQDPGKSLLNSIESGANLYYSCITKQDDIIKETDYDQGMFPSNYNNSRESLISQYEQLNPIFKDLRSQTIKEHKQLVKGVYETIYEKGNSIIVNYNNVDVEIEGNTIRANNYLFK